jgi:ABC-2 type transport system permease protein
MKAFGYLIRRELWQHRSVWMVPAGILILLVLTYIVGLLLGHFGLNHIDINVINNASHVEYQSGQAFLAAHPQFAQHATIGFFAVIAAIFNIAMIITIVRYLLSSLYGDRKDRSILFWLSLPISDGATVASKLLIAVLVAPLVTFAFLIVTQLIGVGAAEASGTASFWFHFSAAGMLHFWAWLIVALMVQSLWYLPFWGWLMMASAWARQAPVLWAAIPPLVGGVIEAILFGSDHFFVAIAGHAASVVPGFNADVGSASHSMQVSWPTFSFNQLATLLASAELWIGVGFGIVFIVAALFLRRWRAEDY